MADFDKGIDVTGESVPIPLFRTQKSLNHTNDGEILRIITDEPASVKNFPEFTNKNPRYELLDARQEGKNYYHLIKKIQKTV